MGAAALLSTIIANVTITAKQRLLAEIDFSWGLSLSTVGAGEKPVRIGFHPFHDFYRAMLEPVYLILKEEFPCLMTKDLNSLLDFKPQILLVADNRYYLYRPRLPGTIIVWVRHGFVSKNGMSRSITGSDFSCVSSEWLRDEYLRNGWNPRLGYWVTGFPAMDGVLNPDLNKKGIKLPDDFSRGKATLLYAPTWNKLITSVEMLGDKWLDRVRQAVPELNIIIKPHPHIPKVFPKIMSAWRKAASDNERILLVDGDADIYPYFPLTDILLSDAASPIFYFLALDRPIILVNNPLRFKAGGSFDPEGPEWLWRDVGIEINHADELESALVRSLRKPEEKAERRAYYRDKIFGDLLDGRAAERIADRVRSLINPKPEDEWVSRSWNSVASRQPVSRVYIMMSRLRLLLSPLSLTLETHPRLKYFLLKLLKKFSPVR
ncbi:hypothetical protein ES708_11428 [subsurface metagenome]